MEFHQIERGIARLQLNPEACADPAEQLLRYGEHVLENWLHAHGKTPTQDKHEGFRLLALHRQGARGNPSFNACRETCRELVYHVNLLNIEATAQRIALSAMVAKHLTLFVKGKLEEAELGEFCCSSRQLRGDGADQQREDQR